MLSHGLKMEWGRSRAGVRIAYICRPKHGADGDQRQVEDETNRDTKYINEPPCQVPTETLRDSVFNIVDDVVAVCLTQNDIPKGPGKPNV